MCCTIPGSWLYASSTKRLLSWIAGVRELALFELCTAGSSARIDAAAIAASRAITVRRIESQEYGNRSLRSGHLELASRMLKSRWIAIPLSAVLWASCVVVVIVWTPLVLLYRLFTFPWDRDRYHVGRLFHDSAATVARINPFWKFRIRDDVHPDDRRPYVFVANHSSFTDVFLLASLPWEMKYLSKKSIFRIPLLGWQMTIAGDVPIV